MTTQAHSKQGYSGQIKLDGKGALYKQIERAVRDKIRRGHWRTGHRLPSEQEFVEMFSTTRSTVNKALSRLEDAGLLERRRRAGTRVAQATEPHAVIGFLDIQKEIESKGCTYSYEVMKKRKIAAGAITASWPEVRKGTPLLHIVAEHKSFDQTEVIEERLINLKVAPEAIDADFEKLPPNIWLLNRLPCTRLIHTITARVATAQQAAKLGIRKGAPLLVSQRRTWADMTPVTWVRLTFPGETNEFVGEFNPLEP